MAEIVWGCARPPCPTAAAATDGACAADKAGVVMASMAEPTEVVRHGAAC